MELETLGGWELPHFDRDSLRVEGYVLLGLYVLLFLIIIYARRREFRPLRGRKLAVFAALFLLTVPLNNILWLGFTAANVLPTPGVPAEAPAPSLPLLGTLTIFLAGAFFGAGPAMLTGLVAGVVRGGLASSRVFAPPEMAAFGLVAGLMLRQAYRGRTWRLLRQPIVVGLVGAGLLWVLLWINVYTATGGSSLSALDYTRSLLLASVGAVALDGLLSGLLVQGLYLIVSQFKPPAEGTSIPPHLRSMNRRLLAALVPLTLLMILAIFSAVTTTAVREAIHQAVIGMTRDARRASEMMPRLFSTGQDLLKHFASTGQLRSPNAEIRREALEADLKLGVYGPFFSQLILVDQGGDPISYYPERGSPPVLAPEEEMLLQRTLNFGSPEKSHVIVTEEGPLISFTARVEDENGQPLGALVGRALLTEKTTIANMLSFLQGADGADPGYIVDDRGLMAFHPNGSYLLQPESIDRECSDIGGFSEPAGAQTQGRACQDLASDGTRRLVYYLPVEAMEDWTVVITYRYERVLDRATKISAQSFLILLGVTAVLAVTIAWITRWLIRPLQLLATAARDIAEGQLDHEMTLTGEDEVGQLGRAFERMRVSLRDRLDDLKLLLRVSQAVSSSLDMTRGVPTILEAALQATNARFARLVLFNERGDPDTVLSEGDDSSAIMPIDLAMARLGRRGGPVRIENVAEARGVIDPNLVGANTQALIAVPMRSKDHNLGVMWLGYDQVHQFSETEVGFLFTLTSQAAVAVENAKLFQSAEGGRRRLAAILESTSDAVIVTDHADHVLLLNPAAAVVFGAETATVSGMPIDKALHEERLIRLLTAPMDDGVPLVDEVPLPDGRTLYASASVIVSSDGQTIGRVAVLRDITYLKELDEMKSEFVATVSHDLRAPLTFMRGYAAMIPMVGEVSPKQKRYVDKIMVGIEQMTELIDDLLDLGRIEAGVGLMSEPCRLDDIIVALVDSMHAQAKAKGLTLRLDRTEDVTIVIGDAALLRRVLSNLVDNAIKYTPEGGEVTVSWETRGNRVLISVADTGIGITKADQVRLFEKFSRIKRRETINIKGSGLGLAIVKSIVERHQGRVWVESELDQGSTFYVELPVGEPG